MIDPETQAAIRDAVNAAVLRVQSDLDDRFESLRERVHASERLQDERHRLNKITSSLREEAREVGSRFSEGLVSRARDRYRRPAPVDDQVWRAMLSTPGGAGAVARALTAHLRESFSPRGVRDVAASAVSHEASVARIVEALEACAGRLDEFKPLGAADVNLKSLGVAPFAPAEPALHLHCSFCGKAQREVSKLIAGPCVYICNECVDLSNSIISDG